jgi:anti-sigma regulatory factor (Ser/Thr protein kinase)
MKKTNILEVKAWAQALQQGAKTGYLSCPTFLKPYHLVMLALMLKQHNAKWLELSEEIETYALRMGLWQAANIIPPYEIIEYPTQNKFLPVAALTDPSTISFVAKNLTSLIYQQQRQSSSTQESMEIMLRELIENTYKHANVQQSLHGLVCAQSWPLGNLAQIVFADSGIGIRASLNENPLLNQALSMMNACQLACDLGVTSKPLAHTGYGLALTRALMKQSQGTMIVLSLNEGYLANATQDVSFETPSWEGAIIILEWPLDHSLDVGQIYASWPLPEDFE